VVIAIQTAKWSRRRHHRPHKRQVARPRRRCHGNQIRYFHDSCQSLRVCAVFSPSFFRFVCKIFSSISNHLQGPELDTGEHGSSDKGKAQRKRSQRHLPRSSPAAGGGTEFSSPVGTGRSVVAQFDGRFGTNSRRETDNSGFGRGGRDASFRQPGERGFLAARRVTGMEGDGAGGGMYGDDAPRQPSRQSHRSPTQRRVAAGDGSGSDWPDAENEYLGRTRGGTFSHGGSRFDNVDSGYYGGDWPDDSSSGAVRPRKGSVWCVCIDVFMRTCIMCANVSMYHWYVHALNVYGGYTAVHVLEYVLVRLSSWCCNN
jgi:hypothetical protein